MYQRSGGLLLHITSLPGGHGIGDLGPGAHQFVDLLAGAGQHIWQVLPFGPAGAGNSPYDSRSSFAGNPLMIDLSELPRLGLTRKSGVDRRSPAPHSCRVDFGRVRQRKERALQSAYTSFLGRAGNELRSEVALFSDAQRNWLDDYALYQALRDAHGGDPWHTWETGLRRREPGSLERARRELAREIGYHQFTQYLFERQWERLRAHANENGVALMGDIPIYVTLDSAEVWSNPHQFLIDEDGNPDVVAGVPPDIFSKTGQLWGNPCYDWDAMASDGYSWWLARFRRTFDLADIVRVDHFRGFMAGWQVPSGSKTAVNGEWAPGPGRALFDAVSSQLGTLPIVVEDLGVITQDVIELRESLGYPGMKILQFAFDGDPDNFYLPHHYPRNCMVYTGTHDNDTTRGWFASLDEESQGRVTRYVDTVEDRVHTDMIRLAWSSSAVLACAPVQDVIGLGSEARMNVPGKARGNWSWRLSSFDDLERRLDAIAELSERFDRSAPPLANPENGS